MTGPACFATQVLPCYDPLALPALRAFRAFEAAVRRP